MRRHKHQRNVTARHFGRIYRAGFRAASVYPSDNPHSANAAWQAWYDGFLAGCDAQHAAITSKLNGA